MKQIAGLLAMVVILATWAVVAEAQQPKKVARIAFLFGLSPSVSRDRMEAFRQGLTELGYAEGKNIVVGPREK
jgi:DNA-binding LacI/PurR family transcriptional regulator